MRRRDFFRQASVISGLAAGTHALGGARSPLAGLVGMPGRRTSNGAVRLNSNENPLGISEAAKDALVEAIVLANRYPSDQQQVLVSRLAAAHDVAENQLVLGTGSAEVLQMAVQAYAAPRAKLIMADPTYEAVTNYQRTEAYELVKVPLTANHEHDIGRMREAAESSGHPALVYLCNPNNPTATITPSAAIDAWIADAPEHVFFLSDEAYIEYVEDERMWSSLPWIAKKPERARREDLLQDLRSGRTPNRLRDRSSRHGRPAHGLRIPQQLQPARHRRGRRLVPGRSAHAEEPEANRTSREMVESTLDELGLQCMPTQANFLMHRINGDLATYRGRMAEAGFLVGRDFPPMLDWNRLSFGLPEDMSRFCDTLRDFRGKGWI